MRKLFLVFVGLCFFSCNSTNEENHDRYTLEFEERFVFEIDEETKRRNEIVGFIEQLNSFYIFNDINYKLYLYDLDSKANWKTISLDKEGPNGLGEVSKMLVINLDSIITFNRLSNRLYMISDEGKSVETHQVFSFDEPDPTGQLHSNTFDIIGSKVFMLVRPNNRTSLDNYKVLFRYDLLSGTKEYLIDWPQEYMEQGDMRVAPGFAAYSEDNKSIILSLPYSSDIYVLNDDLQLNSYYAGSNRVGKFKPYEGEPANYRDIVTYQLSESKYSNIFYDKFSKTYFRSAFIGKNIPSDADENKLLDNIYNTINNDKIFTITLILNENFDVIGEVEGKALRNGVFSKVNGIYDIDNLWDEENEDIFVLNRYELIEK